MFWTKDCCYNKERKMKISDFSLHALVKHVLGEDSVGEYQSGKRIVEFFNGFGVRDVYDYQGQGLPGGRSRKNYTLDTLNTLNGTNEFRNLVEMLADSRRVNNVDEAAKELNKIIVHDGYTLTKDTDGIYKISGSVEDDEHTTEAHFEDIRPQIIQTIQSADFLVWVAVAWFRSHLETV